MSAPGHDREGGADTEATCIECERTARHVTTEACGNLHAAGKSVCWAHRCDECLAVSPLDDPDYGPDEVAAFADRRILNADLERGQRRDVRMEWHIPYPRNIENTTINGGSCRVLGSLCLEMAKGLWATGGVQHIALTDAEGNEWHWWTEGEMY